MASPREMADRRSVLMGRPDPRGPALSPWRRGGDDRVLVPPTRRRPDDRVLVPPQRRPDDRVLVPPQQPRRHHFHDVPPWPHQRYNDYVYVDRGGWWPRWYPYWDPQWYVYWWQLYEYYGGDASPEYAEYARDAIIRQYAPQWGLVVSGMIGAEATQALARQDHHGGFSHGGFSHDRGGYASQHHYEAQPRARYPHPHDHYRDYVTVQGAWWPRWFPYWDPSWQRYWWQLYEYYGGDANADYAQYARDAHLRTQLSQGSDRRFR